MKKKKSSSRTPERSIVHEQQSRTEQSIVTEAAAVSKKIQDQTEFSSQTDEAFVPLKID